jgi:NitT/TauT family transport system ATP-binding protein
MTDQSEIGTMSVSPINSFSIEFRNVVKLFDGLRASDKQLVFDNLNLKLPCHEGSNFVVLLGPSGCGKSTALSLISGLQRPNQGQVLINDEELVGPNHFSATVPQAYTCFPWKSVLGNVLFGLRINRTTIAELTKAESERMYLTRRERKKLAMHYLEKVGLGDRLRARPKQLSGGMQQRVAIARTLVLKPPIVLMDEPFGALDAQTRADMQQMLLDLWIEENNLVVFVTHDINEALLLADDIVVFPLRPVTTEKISIVNVKNLLGEQKGRSSANSRFGELAETLRQWLKPKNIVAGAAVERSTTAATQ